MVKPIFDLTSGDLLISNSDNTAVDGDGNMMMRLSDSMALDLNSGETHIVSGWDDEDG